MSIAKLDRPAQLFLLEQITAAYPGVIDPETLIAPPGVDLNFNLAYLLDQKLISGKLVQLYDSNEMVFNSPVRVTAAGIDFLAEDGGIGAILNTVTIKLHADTLRQLIEARVQSSALPDREKATLLKQLASLPRKVLEKATDQLIGKAIESLPDIAQWLQTLGDLGQSSVVQT